MRLGDPSRDDEAQAGAGDGARDGVPAPEEALEARGRARPPGSRGPCPATSTVHTPFARSSRTVTEPWSGVNLTAFERRLSRTWPRRIASPGTTCAPLASSPIAIDLRVAAGSTRSMLCRTISSSSTDVHSSSTPSVSERWRSRRSSTSRVSRSAFRCTTDRNCTVSSPSDETSSSSSSAYPLIAASGVRSSWETVATNSSLARAAACSVVVSRSEKIRPMSEPSLAGTGAAPHERAAGVDDGELADVLALRIERNGLQEPVVLGRRRDELGERRDPGPRCCPRRRARRPSRTRASRCSRRAPRRGRPSSGSRRSSRRGQPGSGPAAARAAPPPRAVR